MFTTWWQQYGDYILDIAMYLGAAAVLILLSKWLWEAREQRRLRKETALWRQQKDDELNSPNH